MSVLTVAACSLLKLTYLYDLSDPPFHWWLIPNSSLVWFSSILLLLLPIRCNRHIFCIHITLFSPSEHIHDSSLPRSVKRSSYITRKLRMSLVAVRLGRTLLRPKVCPSPFSLHLHSHLPLLWEQQSLLHADSDPFCWWTHDLLLQVHEVQQDLER